MMINFPSFADKPLILTFQQLGINPVDYFDMDRADYINIAADYFLEIAGEGAHDYEVFCHYEWEIDYLAGLIKIPRSALID
jgi:hypothetical protein